MFIQETQGAEYGEFSSTPAGNWSQLYSTHSFAEVEDED
jgi:hypothetical protein